MSNAGLERPRRTRTFALLMTVALASAFGLPESAGAQSYPAGPVKIVVPFPGGGPLDFVSRLLAERLAASLKQPFVVDNRPGAAGNIGTEAVAKAAPDGQTLLVVLDTPLTVNPWLYKKLPFDPERDFSPISIAAGFYQMLVVHPSVPVSSLREFVDYAKKQRITYGSGGASGRPGHLTMEYFRQQTGFDAVHVSYRGNAQVVTDLIGGQVQAGFVATPGVVQHVRDGKLKGLAVSGSERSPLAPDVPTVSESGYPGFDVGFYIAMLAPKDTPQPIRALLEREVRQALAIPEVKGRLRAQELEPIASTSDEATARLKATAARWRDVIKAAKIQPE
jgi:tripartite-type tricarboxylate transporter receptor subunit TctC